MLLMEALLTTEDVARILQMTEYTVRDMLKRGDLDGFKVGGQWRVRPEVLRAYVKKQEEGNQTK